MRERRTVPGLLPILLTLSLLPAAAQELPPITIGVSPPKVELALDSERVGGAMRVVNFGSLPAEYCR